MKDSGRMLWLVVGMVLGGFAVAAYLGLGKPAQASNDRYEDYVMCTGPVAVQQGAQTDGVWLLDYRAGKLLGTVIDRGAGKIVGWAELDLVAEFGIQPRQNVHFLMTCGQVAASQAALYIAETSTGKFGVYTLSPRIDGQPGWNIRKHDLVMFRQGPKGK